MQNLNLTNLYLDMVSAFGATGFELSSLVGTDAKPIDMLIYFNGCDVSKYDEAKANDILKANISGEVNKAVIKVHLDKITVYVESLGDHSAHWND
jgi:hypothetical protein